jgi:hypothetical protein
MKPPSPTPAKRVSSERTLRRLLAALQPRDAHATQGTLDPDTIIVCAASRGVTIVRATLPAAVATHAVSEGLAAWSLEGKKKVLRLTDAGRAFLRRDAAGRSAEIDGFRAQHDEIAHRAATPASPPVMINESESPLAWLARRKGVDGKPFLAPAQIEAGERFRRDIEQAQLLQRVTANWDASMAASRRDAGVGLVVSDLAIDARKRLTRAYDSLGGELGDLLTDVCGYLKGLETVERERGWPARSGKVALRIALELLAAHYGIASLARGPDRSRGLRHWGDGDYRPQK